VLFIKYGLIKGPNDNWHIDGYDKLGPYGLKVHGCVDGLVHYQLKSCYIYMHIIFYVEFQGIPEK